MMPIQELLNRIRWDREFGAGHFEIGYYDRVEARIIRLPFDALQFEAGDHFAFEIVNASGEVHSIPYHRVHQESVGRYGPKRKFGSLRPDFGSFESS
jgi:uncharacterized protein (UPF0248 family)